MGSWKLSTEFFKEGVINSIKCYQQIRKDEDREVKLALTRGQLLATFSGVVSVKQLVRKPME